MKIRQFTQGDFAEVREVDSLAWAGPYSLLKKQTKYRTMANLLSNWNDDPEGCFVAEHHDELLGYVFCHICGSLGYIGTFGVHPKHRGRGIGRKLLMRSIEHLESNRCTTIGLETRPENPYNVGMYLAHGFSPKYLTLVMERTVVDRSVQGEVVEWSELDGSAREVMADKFLATCDAVQPGLDYVKMAESRILTLEGKICAFGNKRDPSGFSFVRTAPKFVGDKFADAFVEAMVVRPGSETKFIGMIRTLEGLAREWGKCSLVVSVTSSDWNLIQTLARNGFRVRRTLLRMMYRDKTENRRGVNLNFWAM
jgi:ribosomal protein S18 acetylase RimI-like enzyme